MWTPETSACTTGTRGLQTQVTALSSRPAGGAPQSKVSPARRWIGLRCKAKPGKVIYCTQLFSDHSNPLFSVNPRNQMLPDGALVRTTARTDNAGAGVGDRFLSPSLFWVGNPRLGVTCWQQSIPLGLRQVCHPTDRRSGNTGLPRHQGIQEFPGVAPTT